MTLNDAKFTPLKEYEFDAFARWLSLPSALRDPQTQQELSAQLNVENPTLSVWKQTNELWSLVDKYRREWVRDSTSDIIEALIKRIKKTGDPVAVKLFAEMFEKFVEKREEVKNVPPEQLAEWGRLLVEYAKAKGFPTS